jgi:hypothetical protein
MLGSLLALTRNLSTCSMLTSAGCELDDIQSAFVNGMSELCTLHGKTNVGVSGEYLPSETDRQVGLGLLGLANLFKRTTE